MSGDTMGGGTIATTDHMALADELRPGVKAEAGALIGYAQKFGALETESTDFWMQRYACDPVGTRSQIDLAIAGARGVTVRDVHAFAAYPKADEGGPADPLPASWFARHPGGDGGRGVAFTRGD